MSQGKPRKEWLLEQAKKDHKDITTYGIKKIGLAEFLSNRLNYSSEFIYDLIEEWKTINKENGERE